MSVIAVRISKSKIEIAGDSQTTAGNNKYVKYDTTDKHINAYGKIFQVNNMTFGCAGYVSDIGLLQIFAKTHKPKEMERDFIIDWLIEFKEWANSKAKIGFNDLSFTAFIISDKRVFKIYSWVDAHEVKSFDSLGSGQWLAMGAMEAGASVEDAVKVANKYDLYCSGEIHKLTL